MLNQFWSEPGGGKTLPMDTEDKGLFITDPEPPGYMQDMHRKSTVQELLMIQHQNEQKWNYSPDYDNSVSKFPYAQRDIFRSELSPPQMINTPTPASPTVTMSPENGHITPQYAQHPGVWGNVAQSVGGMSLFQWQVHQEEKRVEGVPPELFSMQDADGDTYLHIAVAQGRRALSYVLAGEMAKSGTLDVKDYNGQTALQVAVAANQRLIIQDLLTLGAEINTRDRWGRSPLHVCAEKGHFHCLQSIWMTMRQSGQQIDIEMFNYDGFTPLHTAILSHNVIVKELRSLDDPSSCMAVKLLQKKQTYSECVKMLLHMGASSGTRDLKCGRTSLHFASEEANLELLQLFLDQPSSLCILNDKTFSGNTALHLVCALRNHEHQVEAVELLVRRGADPMARNLERELPCHLVPPGLTGKKVQKILKGKCLQL
ncbi:NF-kappa-B inhibitor zeta [Thalassophryne amazonica]|uniref:NF-kappa-B inhibitor zeta n=1 Tax=Thalassophryne amazonica TaxID=390379 RepID=UPI001471F9D2|nr:NF-kappa-B inhibitor zeta [Thalassophryne amazonica]